MFVTKVMMDGDMFCYIHEGGQWITSHDGSTKFSGGRHKSIDVNCNMSHTEFVATIFGVLDTKISFILKFDLSCLVSLDDDASVSRMFRYSDRFCRVYVSTCEEIVGQPTM